MGDSSFYGNVYLFYLFIFLGKCFQFNGLYQRIIHINSKYIFFYYENLNDLRLC